MVLVTYTIYVITNGMRVFETDYSGWTLYIEIIHWSFALFVIIADCYILTTFEMSHFQLCTVANPDHSVSIIAIGINGNELFKFKVCDQICIGHKEQLPGIEVFLKNDKNPNRNSKPLLTTGTSEWTEEESASVVDS